MFPLGKLVVVLSLHNTSLKQQLSQSEEEYEIVLATDFKQKNLVVLYSYT